MPAAAVIPAPIAYTKVAAVKKLVVEFWGAPRCPRNVSTVWRSLQSCGRRLVFIYRPFGHRSITLKKLECSKQAVLP